MQEEEKERFYRSIGNNIKEARLEANLKQEAFANFLGLSRASIVNIEKGRQHPPIHLLWEMARILNTTLIALLPKINPADSEHDGWKEIIEKKSMGNEQITERVLGFIDKLRETSK